MSCVVGVWFKAAAAAVVVIAVAALRIEEKRETTLEEGSCRTGEAREEGFTQGEENIILVLNLPIIVYRDSLQEYVMRLSVLISL